MAKIQVLDSGTIDKIAAGEVVERPSSVVKELVENAVDANAKAITVEIKDGGISLIRVTDNGSGIETSQVRNAFLRHATSKITSVQDLESVKSLGFRGEALSSICAVAKVELITKTKEALTGIRYLCEGANEKEYSEVGAPEGTTILVRNLFFNTPVRRKFLKQPQTEGGYIIDLMEHMALSRPDVSFKLVVNGQVKFHTSGNGNLKEVIYRIYGRETAANLIEIDTSEFGLGITGYLGKPVLNRSNRNFENYYINGRYIKSSLLSKAIEDGYSQYLMQHKFPFVVLHFQVDTQLIDVNVHPTKMDVRFTRGDMIFDYTAKMIMESLKKREMIPEVMLEEREINTQTDTVRIKESVPEPFEHARTKQFQVEEEMKYESEGIKVQEIMQNPVWNRVIGNPQRNGNIPKEEMHNNVIKKQDTVIIEKVVQMDIFEDKLLTKENRDEYRILGQVFDTYWIIAFHDKMFIVDQHAAHEKVKYERLLKQFREKCIVTQSLNPPIVVTLSAKEEQVMEKYKDVFLSLGFEVESFEGREYALRGVPTDLYGCNEKELFLEILDELIDGPMFKGLTVIEERLASMACKAAVKGNNAMSKQEMEVLIDELLSLENPYNCPHGRPTIISMSKFEIEKKFKRIV
ncbi:MAG TPA: DNA mismatch repair endonuclease MutL [Lachnospiraceae bacterium]|nr:DNA mismatch repair endonuclease MutL [Lachnospiraceae bacterium]